MFALLSFKKGERKVRVPKRRVVPNGNGSENKNSEYGKCHRDNTSRKAKGEKSISGGTLRVIGNRLANPTWYKVRLVRDYKNCFSQMSLTSRKIYGAIYRLER